MYNLSAQWRIIINVWPVSAGWKCAAVKDCDYLASALMTNLSSHRELNLNHNEPEELALKMLCDLQKDPQHKLETL